MEPAKPAKPARPTKPAETAEVAQADQMQLRTPPPAKPYRQPSTRPSNSSSPARSPRMVPERAPSGQRTIQTRLFFGTLGFLEFPPFHSSSPTKRVSGILPQ